jgi:hypothetical protein
MVGAGPERHDAPIGTGHMDFGPILEATSGTTEWYIVEQDTPADPLADVRVSLGGMNALVE